MKITSIRVVLNARTDRSEVYDSYRELMLHLRFHYFAFITSRNRHIGRLATSYLNEGYDFESKVEKAYELPTSSLTGAQLIFGSRRQARIKLRDPELRRKIINNKISYQVTIYNNTRKVIVYKTENEEQSMDHSYTLAHNFYKYATQPFDPINLNSDPIIPAA